jgi:hypothetical protein
MKVRIHIIVLYTCVQIHLTSTTPALTTTYVYPNDLIFFSRTKTNDAVRLAWLEADCNMLSGGKTGYLK